MAQVSSDIRAAVSTQYEAWFNEAYNPTVAVEAARFAPLIQNLDLPDHQGDRVDLNWLGAAPQMREWTDEKRAIGLNAYHWDIVSKSWEATIEVDLNWLADNRWMLLESRIREMARNTARHRYNLLTALITAGETSLCYDGQNFFDTDHAEGDSGSQSNELTGSGSTTIDHFRTDYYAAYSALMGFKDDKGEPIWAGEFRPLVWIPNAPILINFLNQLRDGNLTPTGATATGGNSNVLANKFDLVVDPKLTDLTDWYMFNPEGEMKPFISLNREEIHYEDNFGSGTANPDVFDRRIGKAGPVGRDNMTYGMWQKAIKIKNS